MQRSLSTSERASPSVGPSGYTAEDFSFADAPRPFKNPQFQRNAATGKRAKTLKQVLTLEKERVDAVLEARKAAGPAQEGQQVPQEVVSASTVEAPPSLMPQKRYCDVTGLEAKYQDPRSTLRYHNPEVYDVIKTFQPAVVQAYLAVRGQGVVLR